MKRRRYRNLILGFGVLALLVVRLEASFYRGGSFDGYDDTIGGGAADFPQISNDVGATNIVSTGAWVTGQLLHTGAAPAQVIVFWGETDGANEVQEWSESFNFGYVTVFENLTHYIELDEGKRYYYRFCATNAVGEVAWALQSQEFATPGVPAVSNGDGVAFGRTSAILHGWLTAGLYADVNVLLGAYPDPRSRVYPMGRRTVAGDDLSPNPFYVLVDDLEPETTYGYIVSAENEFGVDETEVIWFTTGTDNFMTTETMPWYGGGAYDGYDEAEARLLMPGVDGSLLLLR